MPCALVWGCNMLPNRFILDCKGIPQKTRKEYVKSERTTNVGEWSRWEFAYVKPEWCSNGTEKVYDSTGTYRNYPHVTFAQFVAETIGDIE